MRHRIDARSLLLGGAESMAAGRKITDEAEARACLKAATSSGSSRIAWARAHGVDGRSLHAWAMNLAKRGASAASQPRLVELVPRPTVAVPRGVASRLVVHVGELVVEVDGDFDEATLVRLVRTLRAC
jgi:hypothetical protein